jgi:hypothetical protein
VKEESENKPESNRVIFGPSSNKKPKYQTWTYIFFFLSFFSWFPVCLAGGFRRLCLGLLWRSFNEDDRSSRRLCLDSRTQTACALRLDFDNALRVRAWAVVATPLEDL